MMNWSGPNGVKGPCRNSDDGQHQWANVTNAKGEVTGQVCTACGETK